MHGGRKGLNRQKLLQVTEAVSDAGNVDDAIEVVRQGLGLDHVNYHMAASGSLPTDGPFIKSTYPAQWISRYVLKGYWRIDPIAREGFLRSRPFGWHQLEITETEREFLADAQAHGLGPSGYSIPIVGRSSRRAMLSLNTRMAEEEWDEFIRFAEPVPTRIAQIIHLKAQAELKLPIVSTPLAPREAECLMWTARGKDSKAIASILKLSEFTVRSYLRTARQKLDCRTLSQAVAMAIKSGVINP